MTADAEWHAPAREATRFFGDVSAAISHEINNRLAVINEKAGLLNDLAAMLARGREVDPARIDDQSRKIVEQVRLAKQVVGRLNRFAHSVDVGQSTIEVRDLLEFLAALYQRKAAAAEVELSITGTSGDQTVTGRPFLLQTLVGRGLDIAIASADDTKAVEVSAETSGNRLRVRYTGLAGLVEPEAFPHPEQGVAALLACSGACYQSEQDGTALLLDIPDHASEPHGRTP
jgi:C4-dicarboxylate-specific signal transduction histidine kinase